MIEGKGIFAWDGMERRTDRYGSFTLDSTGYDGNGSFPDAAWVGSFNSLVNHRVKMVVEVLESRNSAHVGDIVRNIYPTRPEVGEKIVLGVGKFFCDQVGWSASKWQVGIIPDDGRDADWIDPVKLYRLHDQTVSITITETDEVSEHVPEQVERGDDRDFTMITVPEGEGAFIQVKRG